MKQLDSFWPRALFMAVVNVIVFLICWAVQPKGAMVDYAIVYATLISIVLSFTLEMFLSKKNERQFNPSEFFGAGLLGSISSSFFIAIILYVCGVIV